MHRLPRIDAVFVVLRCCWRKPFIAHVPEEWDAIQRVHVSGTFNVTQAAAHHMIKRSFGRVIMMSSLSVAASRSTLAPYATAKGVVTTLMRELAFELGPHGITCNATPRGSGHRIHGCAGTGPGVLWVGQEAGSP